MTLDKVREHFESEAFEYDGLIPKLIPKYHEQNEIIVKMLPFPKYSNLKVLDLGCGTGVLSYLILESFPNAEVTAFDLAKNMLETCKSNLSSYLGRLKFLQGDFGTDDFGVGYDIVVSGLATHHLKDKEKASLYCKIFQALNDGGLFINREIVLGASEFLSDYYHMLWRQYIKSNGEDEDFWFQKYSEEDQPTTVELQLGWLKLAGFVDVDCFWRYLNYAVFGGKKKSI